MSNNTSGFYNYESGKLKVSETIDDNINMSLTFVKHTDKRKSKFIN